MSDEYEKRQMDDDCEQGENVANLGEDYLPPGDDPSDDEIDAYEGDD